MTTDIQLIENKGRFFVTIKLDGQELTRQGPYRDSDEAEAAARQIAGICQVIFGVVVAPPRYPGDRDGRYR